MFGGAIALLGGGNYHEYLIGGMLGMGLAQTAPGVAVALVTDMSTGLIDRFRSLPMSRWAVLAARSVAELLTQMIGAVVVVCVGLAIGWRVHTNATDVIAAFALALLFGYAFTWAGICLGMTLRSPEAAQQTGFIIFLPMIFISCAFVPIQGMPGWLQPVAEWNPMSAIATACRKLFGNPNPAAAIPCLADAAPRTSRAVLVGGDAGDLRAAGGAPVPPQGARLSRTVMSYVHHRPPGMIFLLNERW